MSKYYVHISWDEVPHLSASDKADLLSTIPEFQRDARSRGIPILGAGLIYPLAEADYTVSDFPIPEHYKRAWAIDTGWNWTAGIWGAYNPDTKITYLYSCYKRGHAEPSVHADAIKARGSWIPGVGDAADINKTDGKQMVEIYRENHHLDIELPNKAVEAGLYKVWCALTSGSLKIFKSLTPVFEEMRFYSRDDRGNIVKRNDHLMDAMRYLIMSGMDRAKAAPPKVGSESRYFTPESSSFAWMAN